MHTMSLAELTKHYTEVRSFTEDLCKPLATEDFVVQSMPDVSPTKWHLAHTAWFFETFLLKPELPDYKPLNGTYDYLFNSYYNGIGDQYPRSQRGLLSRPAVGEIYEYRQFVDQEVLRLLESIDQDRLKKIRPLIMLGLNHEQQHQELILTDLKHVLFQNPTYPVYATKQVAPKSSSLETLNWTSYPGGRVEVGFDEAGFSYDNETPRHEVLLQPFSLSDRLVTNAEYLAFMEAGAYSQAQLWLSDGWALINKEKWEAPLYWVKQDNQWFEFTLGGLQALDLNAPVVHISYYEADAFANWSKARLPSEFEWEHAVQGLGISGNFVQDQHFHPKALANNGEDKPQQMYGDVWEWTRSPYSPYPGFKADSGAIGEYNGKFMSSQMVLKGGSCVSSQNHLRSTYRNFFYPHSRWQFMGLRLAKDGGQ